MGHPPDGELRELLVVARLAAEEAADVIRRGATDLASLRVEHKGTNDLVTDVDRRAQDTIVNVLTREFPRHAILAEEEMDVALAAGVEGYTWIVDPLDGTTNFTRGLPPYAVSIAAEYAGTLVAAVVLNVPLNEMFVAGAGLGTTLDGRAVTVSDTQRLNDALLTTGFPYREFSRLDAYLQVLRSVMLGSRGLRRPGSASVDLAYVACGRFDGFFETGLMPWDVAAGTLLVREAGGRVSTMRSNEDVVRSRDLVATNGRLHGQLLEVVASLGEPAGADASAR